jgi:hypothetical protein
MTLNRGVAPAGLYLGPIAWGLSTQANYSLVWAQCYFGVTIVTWVALTFALVAAISGLLSFMAFRHAEASPVANARKPRTEKFLAMIGALTGLLFASVILLQAYAGIVFTGCER